MITAIKRLAKSGEFDKHENQVPGLEQEIEETNAKGHPRDFSSLVRSVRLRSVRRGFGTVSSFQGRRNNFHGVTKSLSQPAKTTRHRRLLLTCRDPTRGSIMWDIIISFIYHRSCRNYLAAARTLR